MGADLPAWTGGLVAAALGLIFGSFANVCIHRLPERRSVVRPGSACPACGTPIHWYDNIPVVSWLLLAGRCRTCRAPIPWRYPMVEALSAGLVVAIWARHGLTFRWAALSWLAVSILILVPIDWKHGILPDRVTLTGLVVGLLFSLLPAEPGAGIPVTASLAGAAAGGLVPLAVRALYMGYVRIRGRLARPVEIQPESGDAPGSDPSEERREGMGLGDVKMLAMVGSFLGVPGVLLTMLLGSFLGTLWVLPLVATGRHHMKTPVPFGPFLGAAAMIGLFWGDAIIDWYLGLMIGPV